MVHHHKLECPVKILGCSVHNQAPSKGSKIQCLSSDKPFVIKFGLVIHHGLECHAGRLVSYLQSQRNGSYNQM